MSIINKMLRDLDQRQAGQGEPPATAHGRGVHAGTVGLAPSQGGARAIRAGLLVALTVALLAMVAGLTWWAWTNPAADTVAGTAPLSQPAPVAVAPAASVPVVPLAPTVASIAQTPAPLAVAAVPGKPSSPAASSGDVQASAYAASRVPAADVVSERAAVATIPPTPPVLPAPSAPPARSPAVSIAANPEPQAVQQRQAQAGRETLAQAQALWNAGSHDAATDLLQQALALAQQAPSGMAPNGPVVASLARELARMQLADGQATASLEMLMRLAPLVGRDADVWALRANAAQRLSRHQDSVQAYAKALQLRPNEQRWLLGSAVSLAALGQIAQASEMVSRARALGPVSPEVQAYLRQAGVQWGEP